MLLCLAHLVACWLVPIRHHGRAMLTIACLLLTPATCLPSLACCTCLPHAYHRLPAAHAHNAHHCLPAAAACNAQVVHHGDKPGEVTQSSFRNFLIDSPLVHEGPDQFPQGERQPLLWLSVTSTPTTAAVAAKPVRVRCFTLGPLLLQLACLNPCSLSPSLPPIPCQAGGCPSTGFGSFHQQYWLDGEGVVVSIRSAGRCRCLASGRQGPIATCRLACRLVCFILSVAAASLPRPAGVLVAVGVVDVLPRCLSSKYLFWDPGELFSFCTISDPGELFIFCKTNLLQVPLVGPG